ncbi:MAG: cytochrome b/b6 domain-containing protein [Gemmatimonadota bacterium]|jgi:cytochrome b subunit of formate dehydrogenase|nr:cytochrome b/b6 domain-containing protein [Gemmatimonadota bacterium]
MELFREVFNPWGQQVLIGISWVLLYAAIVAGAAFIIGHAVYAGFIAPKETPPSDAEVKKAAPDAPAHITRHTLTTRLSHWVLAAAVLTLLVTGVVPILGIKFPWVTLHWIAGLVLATYTVFHTVHVLARRNLGSMWIGAGDVKEMALRIKAMAAPTGVDIPKSGKWGTENKAFHHMTAAAGLAVVATGLLMMLRVNTIFATANPYILPDSTWGILFVFHGLGAVVFVGAIMVHIYFALHPEKRWITWSMIRGWISPRDYVWHFDPVKWPVSSKSAPVSGSPRREAAASANRDQ